MIGTYAKLGAALALVAAIFLGGYKVADWRGKAALASLQHSWDDYKLKAQAITDAAIAQATKERDAAITANEAISNDYQSKLDLANADAAQFASRLRDATSRLLAGSSALSTPGSGQKPTDPSQETSADQLRKLVELTAALHNECQANADQLEALITEIRPQLDVGPAR